MNLSQNLKKIRKEHNLSQEQLAEQLGVSRQSVSKWESGQAYPEMDKMLQLCQMFNINIDDLLNQDITELNNNKQAKNNINKFIDDFFDYITKTLDMFSAMKFKEKIKCISEQFIIAIFLLILFLIIGTFGSNILSNLLSFLNHNIYYPIYNIFESIYITLCLILGIVLILYIFKIRYLDYYVIKDESIKESEEIINYDTKKEVLKEEKIIIRDPNHSGYKFISGLLKCCLFMIKCIVACIAISFCFSLIALSICLIVLFMFTKTGLVFVGTLLLLLALIIINIIILIILYNFIISKKNKKTIMGVMFILSLLVFGFGIGLISIGFTEFDVIYDIDSEYYVSDEHVLEMNEDLFFESYYGNINYIVSDNDVVKVVYKHSKYYDVSMVEGINGYHMYINLDNFDMEFVRNLIRDINDKKIINYANNEIYVYTNEENINILKNNLKKYYEI